MNILNEVPIDDLDYEDFDAGARTPHHKSAKRSKQNKKGNAASKNKLSIGGRALPAEYEARIAERENIKAELVPQMTSVLEKIRNSPEEDDLTPDGENIIPGKKAIAREYASWVIASVRYINSGGEINISQNNIVEIDQDPAETLEANPVSANEGSQDVKDGNAKVYKHKYSGHAVEADSLEDAQESLLEEVSKVLETWQAYLACVPADEVAKTSERLSKEADLSLDSDVSKIDGEEMVWASRQEIIAKDLVALSRQ